MCPLTNEEENKIIVCTEKVLAGFEKNQRFWEELLEEGLIEILSDDDKVVRVVTTHPVTEKEVSSAWKLSLLSETKSLVLFHRRKNLEGTFHEVNEVHITRG